MIQRLINNIGLLAIILLFFQGCNSSSSDSSQTSIPTATHFDAPNTQNVFSLNDTGWTQCMDNAVISDCDESIHLPQDGMYGRDYENRIGTLIKLGNGEVGFDFLKLDANGVPLINQNSVSNDWSCIYDNATGLTWEAKTTDGSLHDIAWSYSWYMPDDTRNGGNQGHQDGGSCSGSLCDTNAFIDAANATNLCGYNDWRLPTKEELHSLVLYAELDYRYLDNRYFPYNYSATWSSTTVADDPKRVWLMSGGYLLTDEKIAVNDIRLVRGDN